ncbi:MAG: DUF3369 domain-containing protein [Rhodocyclaceae bacterium]|nr:DUF3369 domain-containing protein [Rhodocyclaceae bacterium]
MSELVASEDEEWIIDDDDAVALSACAIAVKPWRVLIVDDEPDIHAVTRMALGKVKFKERSLELLSAYTGAEGYEILAREKDIALVLLDVVMETEDAGLILAHRIRSELDNQAVRIVLRTGQPGQAPEERVIVDYDINDYKAKTELTKQKLFTTVISSLRAYEGLVMIQRSRNGLQKILHGASNLYELKSLREFASGVLNQIGAILDVGANGVLCVANDVVQAQGAGLVVIAATGEYSALTKEATLSPQHEWSTAISQALSEKRSLFHHPVDVLYVHSSEGKEFVIVLTPPFPLGELERDLLGVFCDRIAAAFDNLHMYELLEKAQEATVVALADLAESRDADTGGHVKRVCLLSDAIATRLFAGGKLLDEITPKFLTQIGLASMLHDVGKVATPDAVLLKPAGHTPEERAIMQQHALIGETVLSRASQLVGGTSYLTLGAQIAGCHHEQFDGNGYPRALKGKAIPLGARIVAVVDVFDALLHRRPYKEPWPLDSVIAFLQERRGTHFDPDVVDALIGFVETEKPDWLIGDGH